MYFSRDGYDKNNPNIKTLYKFHAWIPHRTCYYNLTISLDELFYSLKYYIKQIMFPYNGKIVLKHLEKIKSRISFSSKNKKKLSLIFTINNSSLYTILFYYFSEFQLISTLSISKWVFNDVSLFTTKYLKLFGLLARWWVWKYCWSKRRTTRATSFQSSTPSTHGK